MPAYKEPKEMLIADQVYREVSLANLSDEITKQT